ncbi:MAG: hypothetical protein KDA44_07265 [Planctomycetales bacterium]|nr:hypothetical protein [Planctomycetales bacterium]
MNEVRERGDKYDSGPAREVIRLAERMFEGAWSEEDRKRLDALVSTSDEACRVYLDFVAMQFALFRLNTVAEPATEVGEEAGGELGHAPVAPWSESTRSCLPAARGSVDREKELTTPLAPQVRSAKYSRYSRDQHNSLHREMRVLVGLAMGVAATLLFLGLNGMLQWKEQTQPQMAANAPGLHDPDDEIHFAILTESVNCQWSGAVPVGLTAKPDLAETPRVLSLAYGLAQFSVGADADVVIEGPAKLSFHDSDTIQLLEGKLAVSLAEYGEPFRILTPHGNIQVRPGGAICADVTTNLEVQSMREGAEVTWSTSRDVLHRHVVAAGAGVRIEPWSEKGGDATEIAFDETRFVTDLTLPFEPVSPPDLPVQRDLACWYSADQNVRTDRQHRVVCWGDILFGENVVADNAWQPLENRRPMIVENAINGRPAVRFDGRHQSLMSSELSLPDEQTIALVFCERSPSLESGVEWQNLYPNSALVTCVGPPGITLGADRKTKLANLIVGTRVQEGGGEWTMAFGNHTANTTIDLDVPVVATIVYSAEKRNVQVFFNGHRVIDAEANPGVASDHTNLCFAMNESGIFPFFGDLAEYIHFRRALSPAEIDDLHWYLGDRYSLEIAEEKESASP